MRDEDAGEMRREVTPRAIRAARWRPEKFIKPPRTARGGLQHGGSDEGYRTEWEDSAEERNYCRRIIE